MSDKNYRFLYMYIHCMCIIYNETMIQAIMSFTNLMTLKKYSRNAITFDISWKHGTLTALYSFDSQTFKVLQHSLKEMYQYSET